MGQGVGRDRVTQAAVSTQALCISCQDQLCQDGGCDGLEERFDYLVEATGADAGACSNARRRRRRAQTELKPPPPDAERLLAGCPRELALSLRGLQQWGILRCGPWLSDEALRALHLSLQRCHLPQLLERHLDVDVADECQYVPPTVVPWSELVTDHHFSAGEVFRCDQMPLDWNKTLRKTGHQALRLGKVAVVLLAGGAGLRFGGDQPVCCSGKALGLPSGKSILQLLCERVRRAKDMASKTAAHGQKTLAAAIPVFVMTSQLTHKRVVEHFECHGFFGLPSHDVQFFQQPDYPVIHEHGHLLPQSLGGQFARVPGGPGEVIRALVNSSALQQLRDRGVQSLHILGTDNLLAKVCDPVLVGFCHQFDIDCACKITERLDPDEDMELFCVRRRPVETKWADAEEAACGLDISEVSEEMRHDRDPQDGSLLYAGSINSVFVAMSYVREVAGRRMREHRLSRPVPYLDFYVDNDSPSHPAKPPRERVNSSQAPDSASDTASAASAARQRRRLGGRSRPMERGSWPCEPAQVDLSRQLSLAAASVEARERCRGPPEDGHQAWRCDVQLDPATQQQAVRVRSTCRGPASLPQSFCNPDLDVVGHTARVDASSAVELKCSLVVPTKPNSKVLETSLLDFFEFSDRTVGLLVSRSKEYAPVWERTGQHSPEAARQSLLRLHSEWVKQAGAIILSDDTARQSLDGSEDRPPLEVEVSPLRSYEGEGLQGEPSKWDGGLSGQCLEPPCHVTGRDEAARAWPLLHPEAEGARGDPGDAPITEEPTVNGDMRTFYLQEYPLRPPLSSSRGPHLIAERRWL